MKQTTNFTLEQQPIVNEICKLHGLEPEQISFEGKELTPIFDYEAVCALSLKLTDIQAIDCQIKSNPLTTFPDKLPVLGSIAVCTVILPDGRSRTVEDSAEVGEEIAPGLKIETRRDADGMAQNRAVRRGIRSVGINLYNAHRLFVKTGSIAQGHTRHDPRLPNYNEIHALATELDLIVGADKTAYRRLMAELCDGVESSKDLNDIQLRQFLVTLRAMAGQQRHKAGQQAA